MNIDNFGSPEDFIKITQDINKNTCLSRIGQWARNIVANEFSIRNGKGINTLFSSLKGKPAILIGAGPSLDKNIELLKECSEKACLIACDAAHKSLSIQGVKPHIVFVAETKAEVKEFLDYENSEDVILAAHSLIHPSVHEDWKGPIRWFNAYPTEAEPFTKAVIEFTGQIGRIAACGSVVTIMFSFAVGGLKSDPIIMVGMDSAFYAIDKHHAQHSPAGDFSMYKEMEQFDVFGNQCLTNVALACFARWLEDSCCRAGGRTYINATEGGIIAKGCLIMTLQQVLDRYLTEEIDIIKTLQEFPEPEDSQAEHRWFFSDGVPIKQESTYLPEDFLTTLVSSFLHHLAEEGLENV